MTNLLPLEDFRRILSYNPFHFWGLTNATVPVTSACNDVVKQYAWQTVNAAGRSEIAEAIEQAEGKLRDYLGYPVAPQYRAETVPWPRYADRSLLRVINVAGDLRRIALRLPDGKLREIGVETLTYISSPRIVLSDEDGDGLDDTFTATVATTVTDADRIAVYFPAASRLDGDDASEKWRIRPVKVTISGGTATIVGRAWLLVDPILYEGVLANDLDPDGATTYVATVDVYQRWTNPDGNTVATSQGVLVWETSPYHGWWCCCSGCGGSYTPANSSADPAAIAQAVARVGLRDADAGLVTPGEACYNATSDVWGEIEWDVSHEPDRAVIRYLAGVALENQDMARRWQTIVARLAAAELSTRICACDTSNRELYRWQFDLSRAAGANDEQYQISPGDLDNPFGTRAGQVNAWKEVKHLRNLVGLTTF